VLAYHEGDALAAVQTLLDDCKHLRRQLALTEGAMSRGMTRVLRSLLQVAGKKVH
jgi:hypothetical protein